RRKSAKQKRSIGEAAPNPPDPVPDLPPEPVPEDQNSLPARAIPHDPLPAGAAKVIAMRT
ncbi:MAG: signal recognition particle-docking protein FtsY, partial [Candidatus Limnocylindrus sp.]